MQLSKKESSLIEIFLTKSRLNTAQELADILQVSTKTVYRLIKKINETSFEKELIRSQPGKGLYFDYDLYLTLGHQKPIVVTSDVENRQNRMLLELLIKSPNFIALSSLYEGYYVSAESIVKDLEKVRKYLLAYEIRMVKKGSKVSLQGTEKAIRNLIYRLISFDTFSSSEAYAVNNELIHSYDADFITSLLEKIESMLGNPIPYPYNINIFSHMYILLSRFRNGTIVSNELNALAELDSEEKKLIQHNLDKFMIAKKIIQKLNRYLVTEVSEIEIFYLFQYLISSRVSEQQRHTVNYDDALITKITLQLAAYLKHICQHSFIEILENQDFLEHLRLMIYRTKNGIILRNELKNDIIREYPELFKALQIKLAEIAKTEGFFQPSDDEIGFLVLYFAKIIETKKFKKRVLLMCSSGVGTSELLKIKVQRSFSDLEIVDVVSYNQYKKHYEQRGKECFDFILTTINLDNQSNVPSLLVNFMFTDLDKANVENLLEGL